MATKFLDYTGLAYLWQKIKAYFATLLALKADDASVVHKTGDETVDGTKTFKSPIFLKFLQNHTAIRAIAADTANRSDNLDAVGSFSSSNKRLSVIRTYDKDSSGRRSCYLAVVPNSESIANAAIISATLLDVDGNAVPCATAPSTLEYEADGVTPRTNGTDIITRDWIPNDTRIVHTTGDESISGIKKFNNPIQISRSTPSSYFQAIATNSQSDEFYNISTLSFAEESQFCWFTRIFPKGSSDSIQKAQLILARPNLGWTACLEFGKDQNGINYVIGESTSINRTNPTDVLTRDWIPKDTRIVHSTGNENIAGEKTFIGPSSRMSQGTFILTRNDYFIRGQNPSVNVEQGLIFLDKTHSEWGSNGEHGRCANFIAFSYTNGNTGIYCSVNKNEYQSTAGVGFNLQYWKDSNSKVFSIDANIIPNADNIYSLGRNDRRFTQLYATTSTIATSDERIKDNINNIPDKVLDAWEEVKFNQFKFKEAVQEKGESARFHTGVIAQRIKMIFESHSINPFMYGLLCYDEWDNKEEVKSNNGEIIEPAIIAGNLYSIRYEECLCMEAAYQRRKNKILENRISELEKRLAKLEGNM